MAQHSPPSPWAPWGLALHGGHAGLSLPAPRRLLGRHGATPRTTSTGLGPLGAPGSLQGVNGPAVLGPRSRDPPVGTLHVSSGLGPGLTDLQGPLWFASPRCSCRCSAGMPSEEGRAGDSAPGLASSGPGAGGPMCPPGSAPGCLPAFLPGPALGLHLPRFILQTGPCWQAGDGARGLGGLIWARGRGHFIARPHKVPCLG